jgi:uncharacterized protein
MASVFPGSFSSAIILKKIVAFYAEKEFRMECRVGCGACCIVPSISSAIPGMLNGKPAGVRCVQLTSDNRCKLFGKPERPAVCRQLRPSEEMCGHTNREAFERLEYLERATMPSSKQSLA